LNTLNKYITRDYLVTFLMTLLIFTFVMCVGAVIKAIDLIARGVSVWIILEIFTRNIPYILSFSIPMSSLTTVLLMFSRLSLDGEITAMKACGVSIWQIIAPTVLISILLSGTCIYLNSVAAPNAHFAERRLLMDVGVEEPVNLLEEGRFVRDFPNIMIYVGKKSKNNIKDVVVYEMEGPHVKRNVRAKSGVISADKTNRILQVDLYDVRIDQPDREHPMDLTRARYINAKHYPVKLDFNEIWDNENITKKTSDMTMNELVHAIRNVRAAFPDLAPDDLLNQKTSMVVEANERIALALSCFAFTLLGIPLGMKSKRKESSVGVGIALILVFIFYLFIIIADSLVMHPELHPDIIVWFPVIASEVCGFYMIYRLD
jgi:lipopolysaccharide export system permease protein